MASLNNTINAITGRLLSEPLAPAVAASERSRNERDKIASENRLTKRAMDLEERRAKLEEEKATSLLKLRNEFDEKQGKLNREGRLEEIKAQATAYIDRLTTVERQKELARLRSRLGVSLKGATTEEQIEDGLTREAQGDYPAAIGAHKTLEDSQKKIADLKKSLDAALKGDQEFVDKTTNELAAAKAQRALAASLTEKDTDVLGANPSISAVTKNNKIPKVRREQLEDIYNSALARAKPEASLMVLSRDFKRPLAELATKLQGDYQTEQNNLSRFLNEDAGKLAQNRAMVLRGLRPSEGPLAGPEKMPAGESAFDAARERMKGAAAGGTGADLGQDFREPAVQPASPSSPMAARTGVPTDMRQMTREQVLAEMANQQRNGPVPRFQGDGVPQEFGNAFVDSLNPVLRTASELPSAVMSLPADAWNATRNAASNALAPLSPYFQGPSSTPLPMPQRNVGNPAIDAKAVAIWGPDAVPLLKEAEQLATSRGMDPGEQQAVFNAAISGDTNAQSKVKLMLDYVRQAKQADQTGAFQPVMPVREYPGISPAR